MIVLDERKYAENCLRDGSINDNPFFTLSILAKYYYHYLGFRKKKIIKLLLEFLEKNYPKYELNKYTWQTSVEKLAARAGKFPLFEIAGVSITKSELDTIANIHNKVLERLAFTMLCLAKFGNAKNDSNNNWVNLDSKEIFKLARISCKANEREIKIGQLYQMGLLEFSKRNDNLNCRVTFVDNDSEGVVFISDTRELGYEYLKYKGENFIRCADCGILTRGNKNGTKRYCKDCSAYTPQKTKTIICVDCGKDFIVAGNNKRQTRCNDCYAQYRKEKVRQNVQKYRESKEM